MNLNELLQKLSGSPGTKLTDEEQEAALAEKVAKVEKLAKHYETEANLKKRIVAAEKRIKALKPSGGLGGFGGSRICVNGSRFYLIIK